MQFLSSAPHYSDDQGQSDMGIASSARSSGSPRIFPEESGLLRLPVVFAGGQDHTASSCVLLALEPVQRRSTHLVSP